MLYPEARLFSAVLLIALRRMRCDRCTWGEMKKDEEYKNYYYWLHIFINYQEDEQKL